MPLQLRRGADSDRTGITPAVGEPLWVTDTQKLYIGDGSTAGGLLVSGGTDSAAVIALIDSAYVQQRQDYAYSSLTGAPTNVSSFTNDAGYTTYDSANTTGRLSTYATQTYVDNAVAALPDSAQVATIVTSYGYTTYDSANTTGMLATYATQSYVDGAVAALPDSAQVATIVTSYGYSTYDSANFSGQLTAASGVSFDPVGTDNSTDVTLAGSYNYLTLSGQQITLGQVDASTDISNLTTSNVTEGTNLYYTTARADSDAKAAISVTDAGGDGSLTYSSGTITYTGPSAAETRAHFSGGTGVTITSGSIAIGQAVGTSDNVTFADVTVDNLTVNGTTTTVNSITYTVTDPLLHLADSNETSDVVDIGFVGHYSDDGGSTKKHTGFFRDASNEQYYIFNGLVDAGLDSSVPVNVVNRGGTGFTLAALNVGSIAGKYLGIDSDLTAASGTKFDPVGTDNSTNVTLAGSYNYLTLSGQQITLGQIDAATDITGLSTQITSTVTNSYLRGLIDDSSVIVDGNGSTGGVTIQDGGIEVRTGTSSVAYVDLYCEVNNAHRARIKSAPHSSYSGNVDLTLPVSTGTIALTSDIPVAGTDVLAYDANLQSFVTTFTLPTSDGTTGQALTTNGSGTLSFTNVASSGVDSAAIIALVDSAYVQARQTAGGGGGGTDSATVISLINTTVDSAFVAGLTGVATATATTYEYTATASQTAFSGTDDNGATLAYTAGSVLIHRNGILLVSTVDYTATNGTSVSLQAAADSGDTISITAYKPTLVHASQNIITSTVQEADSGQTSFAISHTQDQILVFLNGILLNDSDDYTSNGSTIVLATGADSGDQLTVHNFAKYAASSSSGFNASKTYAYSILFGG